MEETNIVVPDIVKNATNLSELSEAILKLANNNGMIKGMSRDFVAKDMAKYCLNIERFPINTLTRNYGIREKAIELLNKK